MDAVAIIDRAIEGPAIRQGEHPAAVAAIAVAPPSVEIERHAREAAQCFAAEIERVGIKKTGADDPLVCEAEAAERDTDGRVYVGDVRRGVLNRLRYDGRCARMPSARAANEALSRRPMNFSIIPP